MQPEAKSTLQTIKSQVERRILDYRKDGAVLTTEQAYRRWLKKGWYRGFGIPPTQGPKADVRGRGVAKAMLADWIENETGASSGVYFSPEGDQFYVAIGISRTLMFKSPAWMFNYIQQLPARRS